MAEYVVWCGKCNDIIEEFDNKEAFDEYCKSQFVHKISNRQAIDTAGCQECKNDTD